MPLDQLPVEYLFTYTAELELRIVPGLPDGDRLLTWVTSGSFEGPRLRGDLVPGPSSEWAIHRSDGFVKAQVRLLLQTDDGADILMSYFATAAPRDGGLSVRNFPVFEVADERYAWLNTVQALTVYEVQGNRVSPCDVYRLL